MSRNQPELSEGAIKEILGMEPEKGKVYPVNYLVQVVISKFKEEKSNNQGTPILRVYTCTVSDGKQKYGGFVLFVDWNQGELDDGDVISFAQVCVSLLNNGSRIYILRGIKIIQKRINIIGNPEMLGRDTGSKERATVQQAGGNINTVRINQNSLNTSSNNSVNASNYQNINGDYSRRPNQRGNQHSDDEQDYSSHQNQSIKSFYHPLATLTTFTKDMQILVRVLNKSELKTFTGKTGHPGSLFSFTMMDKEGTEMQATCFNKACDKYFDLIQENEIYEIIGGSIKINDRKFSNSKGDYKLIIEESTRIERKDDSAFPKVNFNFINIEDVIGLPIGQIIDVCGYVLEAHDPINKKTKFGKDAKIRRLVIADMTGFKIELTLWKNHADDLKIVVGKVISVKNSKVGDFNGRSLSTIDDTKIIVHSGEEYIPHVENLINFCNSKTEWKTFNSVVGGIGGNSDLSQNAPVSSIKEALNALESISDDKIGVYKLKATICTVNHSDKNFYPGCPDKTCKKKLHQETYQWMCQTCGKASSKPTYYYTLSFRIKDYSAEQWVDIFGDLGTKIFGISCEEYKDLVICNDQQKLNQINEKLEFKTFFFVGKPKLQNHNNIMKKKINIWRVDAVDVVADSRRMIKSLKQLLSIKN
jgi:replication factor A1